MSALISIGAVTVPDDRVEMLFSFVESIKESSAEIDGVRSVTLWMDLDLPEKYAVFVHSDGLDSADQVQAAMGEDGSFEQALESLDIPPDIRRIETHVDYGASLGQMQLQQVLSLSIRQAPPGQASQLLEDVVEVFRGLKYMDGLRGAIIGSNVALREEIAGIALWTDRKPFDGSVQRGSFYEIRLFERIA